MNRRITPEQIISLVLIDYRIQFDDGQSFKSIIKDNKIIRNINARQQLAEDIYRLFYKEELNNPAVRPYTPMAIRITKRLQKRHKSKLT